MIPNKMIAKKAEGLSLSVVVIAVIALVVLVVLILVFSGKLGGFNKEIQSCPSYTTPTEGKDLDTGTGYCKNGALPIKTIYVNGNTKYCCPEKA